MLEITVNAYERDSKARKICLELYGYKCSVCGFDFEEKYGSIGKGKIHVHHIVPISEYKKEYMLNPRKDLRPVCPNCHLMIHSKKEPFTIDELKEIIETVPE
jgi:5-methylcytosine-specific restriction protein A